MISRTQKFIIAAAVVVLVGLFVAGFIASAVVYTWRSAIRAGNETATILNVKAIASFETQYFNTHHRTFATLEQLVSEKMLDSRFGEHVVDGYEYTLRVRVVPTAEAFYDIRADPLNSSTGTKHFYLDSKSGRIHVNSDGPAGPDDPLLDSTND